MNRQFFVDFALNHSFYCFIQVLEGDSIKYKCLASGNPNKLSFTWFVDGRRVSNLDEATDELIIDGMERRLNGAVVRCEVKNSIGSASAETRLDVSYSPVYLIRPESTAGAAGERVTLRCKVDSNPRPLYTWYSLLNANHVISHSPNLTFTLNENTKGEYACKASVAGYADVVAEAKVFIKAKPTILLETRGVHASEGETARLKCKAMSVPEPEAVEWLFQGQVRPANLSSYFSSLYWPTTVWSWPVKIPSDNFNLLFQPLIPGVTGAHKYSVVDSRSFEGIESTLVVKDVNRDDFGGYVCSVINSYGSDSALIQLRKQCKSIEWLFHFSDSQSDGI